MKRSSMKIKTLSIVEILSEQQRYMDLPYDAKKKHRVNLGTGNHEVLSPRITFTNFIRGVLPREKLSIERLFLQPIDYSQLTIQTQGAQL